MYAIEGDIFDTNGVELWSFHRVESHASYQMVQSFKHTNKQQQKKTTRKINQPTTTNTNKESP